jgi:hypothetical protein
VSALRPPPLVRMLPPRVLVPLVLLAVVLATVLADWLS